MKFREHRRGLDESMATMVEVPPDGLAPYVRCVLQGWVVFKDEDLKVEPYGYDARIGWHTHIVTLPEWGVVGFTDGPVP